MKKQITFLTAILFAVSTLIVSCTPESHTHTFSEEWSYDETNHWHAATCEHNEEKSELAEHRFGDWIERVVPTEYTDGWQERFCIECGYREVNDVPRLEHVHRFSEEWTYDEYGHWHVAICDCEFVYVEKIDHNFGDWSVTVFPTETTEGLQERFCTDCGYKNEEIIEKIEHVHFFSETMDYNESYHWYKCWCGEKKDEAEHVFGEYVSNNDASLLADGTKTRTCKICDYAEKVTDIGTKIVCKVGDIILKDGTKISVDDVDACLFDTTKAVGVVALINIVNGVPKPKIIGLGRSYANWAAEETTGYTTNFTGIQSDYSGSSNTGYAFTGDLDGSDNWEYICMMDPECTQNAETNYPIFYLASIYGSSLGLTGTDYETGWYIPSIAEIYKVYKNKEIIQRSLSAAGGFLFKDYIYLSSSQYPWTSSDVLGYDFGDDCVRKVGKYSSKDVFALHDLVVK